MCQAITALIAEGKEEGRMEGRMEGKMETQHKLVCAMYTNGVPRDQIMQIASLSSEQLDIILSEHSL